MRVEIHRLTRANRDLVKQVAAYKSDVKLVGSVAAKCVQAISPARDEIERLRLRVAELEAELAGLGEELMRAEGGGEWADL